MAKVDVTIVGMIAKCLESELCGPRICAKTLIDEENDELSEIASVVQSLHKSSALIGHADRDKRRRTRIQNYIEVILPLYSVDYFKSHLRLNRETTSVSLLYTNSEFYNCCHSIIDII